MTSDIVKNLIDYILTAAREKGISIGAVRLQKLLYLIDVESMRKFGKKATPIKWIYYKYGPFSVEVEKTLTSMGIGEEDVPLKDGKIFRKIGEPEFSSPKIPVELKVIIDEVIERWGDAELGELLDYVYFETEPMIHVEKRREKLDFTLIKRRKPIKIRWTDEDIKKLKEIGAKIKRALEKIKIQETHYVYPPDTIEMMRIWDVEEELSDKALENLKDAKIIFEEVEEEEEEEEKD